MTQKEIEIINAINCEGLDNSVWGINNDNECDIYVQYGAAKHKIVPCHIYIYRDGRDRDLIESVEPDMTFRDRFDQEIDLYFIDNL